MLMVLVRIRVRVRVWLSQQLGGGSWAISSGGGCGLVVIEYNRMRYGTFALISEAKKDRTDPSISAPLKDARVRHQRPCRCCPLRPERSALALWARPVHASSMDESVGSTADDHLTVEYM